MKIKIYLIIFLGLIYSCCINGQSVSLQTYMNPVIPGDHPDPTLTMIGSIFYCSASSGDYSKLNHISHAVLLEGITSWIIAHSYQNNWYAQGRQGLLCKLTYNGEGFPEIQNPTKDASIVPKLSSSGILWMVPHSDFFESDNLNPEWSFLGYTAKDSYSLSDRPGWLRLSARRRLGTNTVIKNDAEHNYSLITQVEFEPETKLDEAGLWIINGPETLVAKVFVTKNTEDKNVIAFSFNSSLQEVENNTGSVVWLKLVRNEHRISGFCSANGFTWTQIGEYVNASAIDNEQTQFNNFTGNQQGLYVKNNSAFFNNYIFRDTYTSISAPNSANQYGTKILYNRYLSNSLTAINNNYWVLFAGVEFGNTDYNKTDNSLKMVASCASSGEEVEVYKDSISSNTKIAECNVTNTGSWINYNIFSSKVLESAKDNHDVYFKFVGSCSEDLFQIQTFQYITNSIPTSGQKYIREYFLNNFQVNQNYLNPFNPKTNIHYIIPQNSYVTLNVFDVLGDKVKTIFEAIKQPGTYTINFDGSEFFSGVYF